MNDIHFPQDTLLIIDDMPSNVKVLLKFLTTSGFKVLIAKDGTEGIQRAELVRPDLILLDVLMPGMDGFEVCQELKIHEKTRDIPIIFMTALTETLDKVKGFEVGAADYITKPFQHEEVLARVSTHLSIRRLQQQLQAQNKQLKNEISIRKQAEVGLQQTTFQLAERTVKLEEYTSELEKRNLELDAFAHTVAHDLKKPLGTMAHLTTLLKNHCSQNTLPDAESIEELKRLYETEQYAVNIIDALLLLAGVSRQTQVAFQPLDMSRIITNVIEHRLIQMREQYQEATIVLPNSWPLIESYEPWIEEIWINYIGNGLKYGGSPPHLELGASLQENGMICFWVRDNGQGLTKKEQALLFTPFTRLHLKRVKGHGLGLSIVQQIVEKLGGQAGVESAVDYGSRFYFSLPVRSTPLNTRNSFPEEFVPISTKIYSSFDPS